MEHLKYPIGRFKMPEIFDTVAFPTHLKTISTFPDDVRKEVEELDDAQLDTAYRPEGWTIRQVVHHCAESHINAFIRFKLALTEQNPTIKPYKEAAWAVLPDVLHLPVEPSLDILSGIHTRWAFLIQNLSETDLEKTFFHPDQNRSFALWQALALYAWHSNHHLAHIRQAKNGF